jgi:putative aldouronate transport system substrate-binding protein
VNKRKETIQMNDQRNSGQDQHVTPDPSQPNTRVRQGDPHISRRRVLRGGLAVGGGALAHRISLPATQAAQQATPVAPPGLTVGVDYFPPPIPGVPPAYLRRPEPYQSVREAPGTGGTVTTLQIIFDPPPPPRDENRYWQELEARLGVTLEPGFVPRDGYEQQVAVTFAGGDLPDLMMWTGGPEQQQALQQGAYTDLTDYLTGDALQRFPNLANIPPEVWEGVKIQGRIWGVPLARSIAGPPLMFRRDWAEAAGMPAPANAEEFFQLMGQFTTGDPNGNQQPDTWGLGARTPFSLIFIEQMFRVPNEWRLNDDGTLTNRIETEEFAAAIAYARRLWDAGFYHPDTTTMTVQQAKDGFVAGVFGGYDDTITGLPDLRSGLAELGVKNAATGLVPPGHDGGQAVSFNGGGNVGFTAIMAGRSDDRVRELLGILNYLAAPFGSEERLFLSNGIEGVHYTVEADGTLLGTEQGDREVTALAYLMNGPFVFYYGASALFSREEQDAFTLAQQELARAMVEIGIDNPALGLLSETQARESGVLDQIVDDGIVSLVTGRASLDTLAALVTEWRNRGGDQIRAELEQSLQEAAG